jgi:hypothetical protein
MNKESIIELRVKASKNFRNQYKTIKRELNLEDFIMYAIVRGKNPETTVKDSNYKENIDPQNYHSYYSYYYLKLHVLNESIDIYLKSKYKSVYLNKAFGDDVYKNEKLERMKYLFDLNEEEIFTLFDFFVQEKAE